MIRSSGSVSNTQFRWVQLGTLATLAVTLMLLSSMPVLGSNFGSTDGCSYQAGHTSGAGGDNCISVQNNGSMTARYYGMDVFAGMKAASDHAINSDIDGIADMSTQVIWSGDPDVRIMDNNYMSVNFYGWVDCPEIAIVSTINGERRCTPQDVRYNGRYEATFDRYQERYALACHELGHTLGLQHGGNGNSCMQTNTPVHEVRNYSSHDKGEVNGYYP